MPVRGVDLTMDLFRSRLMSVVDRLLGRGRRACDGVGISVMDKAILSSYRPTPMENWRACPNSASGTVLHDVSKDVDVYLT